MDWKRLGKKLIFLPLWLIVLMSILCGILLAAVFLKGLEEHPVAYFVYVLSFYTLSTATVFCIFTLPSQYRKIKQKIYDNPYGNRYMTDRQFRAKISLFLSLGINLLYIGVNLLCWYFTKSRWFLVLSFYYLILSLMRFLLLGFARRDAMEDSSKAAWRRCRVCACVLLLLNLSLSGGVLMILYQNRGASYNGILIYVMAMYTFYVTIHAIIEILRYRKFDTPLLSTAKIISLCAALVSMLNLETAMFSQFGAEMSAANQQLMIMLTGAGISIVVITLSVLLIVRSTRAVRA